MAVYFIDGDNGPGSRTRGIQWLTEEDTVFICYADTNSYYTSEKNQTSLLKKTKAAVSFEPVSSGKDAADFAIAIKASILLDRGQNRIYLVSGDGHFVMITKLLNREFGSEFKICQIDVVQDGILDDPENINSLNAVVEILKSQFGSQQGMEFYRRMKELLYRQFQNHTEEKKTEGRCLRWLKKIISRLKKKGEF